MELCGTEEEDISDFGYTDNTKFIVVFDLHEICWQ